MLFGRFFLTKIFESLEDAQNYKKPLGSLATIRETEYAGTFDLLAYPQSIGGMFRDD